MGEGRWEPHGKTGGTAPYHLVVAPPPVGAPPPASSWLVLPDKIKLRATLWPAVGPPRGTVLLFTGRTEYAEKYATVAGELQLSGYAVASVDWRGQGLSDRLLPNPMTGHVNRFSDYQKDVRALVAFARAQGLPQPWHLLAHSMGGAIGLRAIWQHLPVVRAVFTGPMWGIAMASGLRPAALGLGGFSQKAGFSHILAPTQVGFSYVAVAPFERNLLTSDRAQFEKMRQQVRHDPRLGLGGVSLGWLAEAMQENRSAAALPSPALPCLTFLGGEDAVIDPAAITERMKRWPKGTLVTYPEGRHEILMEQDAIRVPTMARTLDFFASAGG